MSISKIEWTDFTFNPWWGCARVSPACRSCYADSLATRYGHDQLWRRKGPRRMLSDAHWKQPLKWNRDAEREDAPKRVFCASMADVFEDHPAVAEPRERLWRLIEDTPWLHWQLLTKRPENVAAMAPWGSDWPAHVWLGTSVENQRWAETRIPHLLAIPAKVRFLSCEPLLSELDLSPWLEIPNGAAAEPRERRLPSGGNGRADNRLAGTGVAHSLPSRGSVGGGDSRNPLCSPAGGESDQQVPAGSDNVSRNQISCTGASAGLAPLLRSDSRRTDDQPQEWGTDGQPTGESGTRNVLGAGHSRTHGAEAWSAGPVRNEECNGEAHHGAGTGNLLAPGLRGTADNDCGGLRGGVSDCLEDRQRQHSISWLICGGESGAKPRPMDPAWARSIVEQGQAANVPVFVKQLGTAWSRAAGAASRKGGDPEEWPTGLRVREFPQAAGAL